MKNIVISGGNKAVVIVGPKKTEEKKMFCWFGMREDKKFEVGTIIAVDIEDAKKKLIANKIKGHYTLREIDLEKEFDTLGIYNHIKL